MRRIRIKMMSMWRMRRIMIRRRWLEVKFNDEEAAREGEREV